ncbi:hypothetical protein P4H70_06695 [Paenibacillus ehimensis]|uniref:RNA polymerase sigma factor n=1 Tax=Paenibacillus ehimensis TaxID=79264 RepID=UPI002CBC0854|nr:hypothetical protein [Paenibacillus ehimensis]MEC0208636.1 hypothetical protein [Paenibacillus ehimensis]HWO95592.1 hypothetical protein [Bacillus sp. (in: firmicutes)]
MVCVGGCSNLLFEDYKRNFAVLFKNSIIKNFFENPHHVDLLCHYIRTGIKDELDNAFRKFFFQIRFIRYINQLIKYTIIDFLRKGKRETDRVVLIYDKALDEDGEGCLGELLYQRTRVDIEEVVTDPSRFIQTIEHETLYYALKDLTERQRLIITLYSAGSLDIEIASKLSVSQQAITKSRLSAFKKMKRRLCAPS